MILMILLFLKRIFIDLCMPIDILYYRRWYWLINHNSFIFIDYVIYICFDYLEFVKIFHFFLLKFFLYALLKWLKFIIYLIRIRGLNTFFFLCNVHSFFNLLNPEFIGYLCYIKHWLTRAVYFPRVLLAGVIIFVWLQISFWKTHFFYFLLVCEVSWCK